MFYDLSREKSVNKDDNKRIAVIPLGSIEYHGELLPLLTDTLIAENISRKCLAKYVEIPSVSIYLYPGIYLGFSHEWIEYAGTISLEPRVFLDVIGSLVNSIDRNIDPHGYLFINGHGGNYSLLEAFARKYYFTKKKPVLIIDLWRIASLHGLQYCHACREEVLLYNYLVGEKIIEVDKGTFPGEQGSGDHLRGYHKPMFVGGIGSLSISIDEYVGRVCEIVDSAIKHIIDQG